MNDRARFSVAFSQGRARRVGAELEIDDDGRVLAGAPGGFPVHRSSGTAADSSP